MLVHVSVTYADQRSDLTHGMESDMIFSTLQSHPSRSFFNASLPEATFLGVVGNPCGKQ